jgi:antitoxin YefM
VLGTWDYVLMAVDDSDSDRETAYLLRSPENARRVREAIARLNAKESDPAVVVKTIEELEEMAGVSERDA